MSRIRTVRWSRWVAAPLGAVALVGLAACGTGTEASAAGGSAAQARPSDAAMEAYASCLQQNGVTLPERPDGDGGPPDGDAGTPPPGAPRAGGRGGPDPAQAPPGVDAATWSAAQEACADLAPAPPGGATPSTSPTG